MIGLLGEWGIRTPCRNEGLQAAGVQVGGYSGVCAVGLSSGGYIYRETALAWAFGRECVGRRI